MDLFSIILIIHLIGLGNSSNSMTIAFISVTIMTVITKTYYRDSGHAVTSMCIWHCLASTYTQRRGKTWATWKNIRRWWELEVFLLEGSKSDLWEYLVSLPQVENAQNQYQNISFTIMMYSLSIKYLLNIVIAKNFLYHPAQIHMHHNYH